MTGKTLAGPRAEGHYPSSIHLKRPIWIRGSDGSKCNASYTFKTDFVRRVSYWGARSHRPDEDRFCWRTRKVSLKAKEDVELRLWLNHISVDGRVSLELDQN